MAIKISDVKEIVNDEIKKFLDDSLDKEMKKLLKSTNTLVRSEILTIIKDSIESVYKTLWYKRDFWKSDIK